MSEINTGGPAFPIPAFTNEFGRYSPHAEGMTLRDYFAAKAMNALADPSVDSAEPDEFAAWCYRIADAMLKARAK